MSMRTGVSVSPYGRLFALIYDPVLALGERLGMREHRRRLLAEARGRVLEIGAGTGLNLGAYGPEVQTLTLAEPEAPMARRLRRRVAAARSRASVVEAPAERLPFADGSFDTVVSTLVLCTVPDPALALAEARRVLAPGGTLLFLEHVRAGEPRLARRQDRLHGPWLAIGHGCHCNRDTLAGMRAAGFAVEELGHGRWRGLPSIVRPLVWGRAAPAAQH